MSSAEYFSAKSAYRAVVAVTVSTLVAASKLNAVAAVLILGVFAPAPATNTG
jgi:hypothetical protein